MTKYKATAVSYLNTKPLLYGLVQGEVGPQLDLSLAIPSECARRLKAGDVDLALTPVAILPELPKYHLVSDYCIGAVGAVKTVCLYGEVPVEEMESIFLDHHSRTSIALVRVLLQEYWQHHPDFIPAQDGYIADIKGHRGGVVIGDRTIGLEKRFPYVYDLAEVWMQFTGLPFVFAAWVSTERLTPDFVEAFNADLARGIAMIPHLKLLLPSPDPSFDLQEYFTRHISYELDDAKRQGLDLFLSYMNQLPEIQLSLDTATG